jgi:hypothetical protein
MHFEPQNQNHIISITVLTKNDPAAHFQSRRLFSCSLYKSRNLAHNFVTVIGLHHPDYKRVMVVYWKEQAVDVSVMDGDESQRESEVHLSDDFYSFSYCSKS